MRYVDIIKLRPQTRHQNNTIMSIQPAVKDKLEEAHISNSMPGWIIIDNAKLLPALPGAKTVFGDSVSAALKKLMNSFYAYGRKNFTWTTSSSSSANNGGMMKGATKAGACGAFNANFRWLAETVLSITGFSQGKFIGQFITQPGSVCIDSKWVGNVCTAPGGFSTTKSYKFKDHYWAVHGGTNYDVCYNHTFGNVSSIIWSKLEPASSEVLKKTGRASNEIYQLEKALPAGNHLVMVKENAYGSWPNWQIFPEDKIPKK
ncbi:MAG: hypothetical protein KAX36_05070 [Thermoflexales bacterium]|nr:hypothetical protein [Thermoflexales bacterium]